MPPQPRFPLHCRHPGATGQPRRIWGHSPHVPTLGMGPFLFFPFFWSIFKNILDDVISPPTLLPAGEGVAWVGGGSHEPPSTRGKVGCVTVPSPRPPPGTRHGKELEEDAGAWREEEGGDRDTAGWGPPHCHPPGAAPQPSPSPQINFNKLGQTLHPVEPFSHFFTACSVGSLQLLRCTPSVSQSQDVNSPARGFIHLQ